MRKWMRLRMRSEGQLPRKRHEEREREGKETIISLVSWRDLWKTHLRSYIKRKRVWHRERERKIYRQDLPSGKKHTGRWWWEPLSFPLIHTLPSSLSPLFQTSCSLLCFSHLITFCPWFQFHVFPSCHIISWWTAILGKDRDRICSSINEIEGDLILQVRKRKSLSGNQRRRKRNSWQGRSYKQKEISSKRIHDFNSSFDFLFLLSPSLTFLQNNCHQHHQQRHPGSEWIPADFNLWWRSILYFAYCWDVPWVSSGNDSSFNDPLNKAAEIAQLGER